MLDCMTTSQHNEHREGGRILDPPLTADIHRPATLRRFLYVTFYSSAWLYTVGGTSNGTTCASFCLGTRCLCYCWFSSYNTAALSGLLKETLRNIRSKGLNPLLLVFLYISSIVAATLGVFPLFISPSSDARFIPDRSNTAPRHGYLETRRRI